ncbi:hypothetical protein N1851_031722 [Merluccius polli]|uniref:DUF6729 domain-containing protein n=1 Tax=Merluccius polli TaxID=89951 RepID=A0AA47M3G2_MERPO|nr:hypothetical protein N1851_031722 [Merluccius polli]
MFQVKTTVPIMQRSKRSEITTSEDMYEQKEDSDPIRAEKMQQPNFAFQPGSNELTLRASQEAQALTRRGTVVSASAGAARWKGPEEVRREARDRVAQRGGDPTDDPQVLAESELQLGRYRGQTFRWLLENDVGYAVNLAVSHEGERDKGSSSQTTLMVHKDALVSYARLFPPMAAAIDRRRMVEGGPQTARGLDDTLVGFGAHCALTYKALYESADRERTSYVQFVRQAAPTAKASRLGDLRKYVLARDAAKKAALVAAGKASRAAQPPLDAAVWPDDGPSDADLLAAATEVDSCRGAPPAVPPPPLSLSLSQPPERPLQDTTCGERSAPGGAQLLPRGWRQTLPEEQHDWVGRALFRRAANGQAVLVSQLRLWWHPPGARPLYTQPPATSHAFYQSPFFLWAPYRMWAYHLRCPAVACGGKLAGAGLYKTARRVLDRSCWYFMGTEYLECSSCHKKVPAWSQDILRQLDIAHREQFPAVLTYKLSCDRAVIGQMRERTLGNSASRLRAFLVEQHTREWMARSMLYLSVLRKLRAPGAAAAAAPLPAAAALPTMHPVPTALWLINVYVRDALTRLDETRARVTSVFGDLLKMDSTKKITKRLAGGAAGTAAWVTNVGNEYGQVLMSVLTASEGDGLVDMAAGLMRRYREAGKAPPKVLYVDRDCCTAVGQCKTSQLFHEWHELVVRLDVWHLMRRFARGVTTDSHQLYGLFMARLSFAVFEWDGEDVSRLKEAKQSEEGRDAREEVKLSAKELARHCRRRTRGVAETERLLREVLDAFWDVTDTMGVPLLDRARMEEIWSTQRRHLDCLQDPAGVELYVKTGELTKGGVRLPVYRCGRGSTSLESFHLHLCRFIPGPSASDVHFQVYLLEGLVRWNENRGRAAVEGGERSALRCYSAQLQHSFDQLTQELLGLTLVDTYTSPREYTGELIGVEYLFSQTGAVLQQELSDPDAEEEAGGEGSDEGFEEEEDEEEEEEPEEIRVLEYHSALLQPSNLHPPGTEEMEAAAEEEKEKEEEEDVLGPDGRGGYQHVVALAQALVQLRHRRYVTPSQAREVTALWLKLSGWDKAAVKFPPRHQDRLVQGRFRTTKRTAHTPGVDSVKRAVLGKGAGAAQWPDVSRLVEAVLLDLSIVHCSEARSIAGVRIQRWGAVMRDYKTIRENVYSCAALMTSTRIQLYEVNQRTLSQWHNKRSKAMMRDTIAIAVPGPSAPQTAAEPLPAPRTLLQQPEQPDQPLQHRLPADASGLAATIRGPLAPELFDLITSSSAITSSNTSAGAEAGVNPSTAATAAVATAATMSRTTLWRRKNQEEKERRARELGELLKPAKKVSRFNCRRCGQPRTRAFGHSRYKSETFCSRAEGKGRTVEEWMAEMKGQPAATAATTAAGTSRPTRCTLHRRRVRAAQDVKVLEASRGMPAPTPGDPCDICGQARTLDGGHAYHGGVFFCAVEEGPGGRTPQDWLRQRLGPDALGAIPRTTAWKQRSRLGRRQKPGGKARKPHKLHICQLCGQPKQRDFGHSQHRGEHYCALHGGKTKMQQPNFSFQPGSNELTLRASQDAQALTRRGTVVSASAGAARWKGPEEVRREARDRVAQRGGDPTDDPQVLAESELQLGRYRGQTFRWLLENDVGYAVNLAVSHEGERDKGSSSQTTLMVHKDALVSYARLFPPMAAAIDRRRMVEGGPQTVRGLDDTLVGFGAHCDLTYKALYDYVQFVRQAAPTAKASRLGDLQKYVLARDAAKAALVAAGKASRAAQPPLDAAVWPDDGPSDADLLAAAAEVDSCRGAPPALLPRGWRQTLPEEQHDWVGRALFRRAANGQAVLVSQLRLWWHPPGARPLYTQPPATSHAFFQRPFFLWAPYRMWAYHLRCPAVACGGKLAGAGLYKTARRVLDRSCWYFMGTEYLECSSCHKKVPAWSQDILRQLDIAHREQFPAVLTYKLSCDRAVIGQMRERTLGNSASRLHAFLVEQHTREWMARSMLYLSVLRKLRAPGAAAASLPTMHPVPTALWLINVYVRDALTRLDETRARVTSVFGDLLKVDSTKKITKRLAGGAAGTAAWVTNVGNE